MTTIAQLPLTIDVQPDLDTAHAGVDFPVTVRLTLAEDCSQSVRLRNIVSADQELHLDTDLIQRNVEIRPGETYRCTLQLRVPRQREIDLSCLHVELTDYNELIQAPQQLLHIRPSLQEIALSAEAICSYGDVTKIQLTLDHRGHTPFEKLRVQLLPDDVVRAGKHPFVRDRFGPGDKEQIIVALTAESVRVNMTGVVEGIGIRHEEKIAVPKAEETEIEPFHFLEPRSLSRDEISIREASGDKERVELRRSRFPLQGNSCYEISIRPPTERRVKEIELRDIPGAVHVRKVTEDRLNNAWRFEIDVSTHSLFRKADKLHYTVHTPDEIMTGEIHITLKPSWHRCWTFAITLGAALTIQGLSAFVSRLLQPDYPLAAILDDFSWSRDYSLAFIPVIPVIWVLLSISDWMWYRLSA